MRQKYISLAKFNVPEALIKSLMLTKKKKRPGDRTLRDPTRDSIF